MTTRGRLIRVSWECVHFLREVPAGLIDDLRAENVAILAADLDTVRNKGEFMDTLGRAMRFPAYFGKNWDAVNDCLTDMSWLRARAYVLFLGHARDFWKSCYEIAGQLVSSWLAPAGSWSKRGIPFHLVFVESACEEMIIRDVRI